MCGLLPPSSSLQRENCFLCVHFLCVRVALCVWKKTGLKTCAWHPECRVGAWRASSSFELSFHSFGPAPEKSLPLAQTDFILIVKQSVASGEKSCQPQSSSLNLKWSIVVTKWGLPICRKRALAPYCQSLNSLCASGERGKTETISHGHVAELSITPMSNYTRL